MTGPMPAGTTIGEIETSLEWILSHTTRFLGAAFVRIYSGDGFILISNGWPAGFFFKNGDRILRGDAAREFFGRQDFMAVSLRRYTKEEFQEALNVAGPEALVGEFQEERQDRDFISPVALYHPDLMENKLAAGESGEDELLHPVPGELSSEEQMPEAIIDRIFHTQGVTAAALFREGSIVQSRGEILLEILIQPVEDILLSSWEVLALLTTGPLVQVTLRLSNSNVTIFPFEDAYILFLTGPEVNFGQIRKKVHDITGHGKT